MHRLFLLSPLLVVLAACADPKPEDTDTTGTTDTDTTAGTTDTDTTGTTDTDPTTPTTTTDPSDLDGDGDASPEYGGADCDDADPERDGLDLDADGATSCDGDCDDADPARFPANPELCNGIDDDCDLAVDGDAAVADVCLRAQTASTGAAALDLLLVVDDSCSMADNQGTLSTGVDELLAPLYARDFHVGVVTTDMVAAFRSGKLVPGPDGALWADNGYAQADAERWLGDAVQVGVTGSSTEAGLDASYTALELLATTSNAGFARDTADLAVVFVSDEPDFSQMSANAWDTWVAGYRPSTTVTVHAFVGGSVMCGPQWIGYGQDYLDLTSWWGGLATEICEPDWQDELAAIGAQIAPVPAAVFVLDDVPDLATLVVTVTAADGLVTTLTLGVDYVFDAATNAVVFTGYVPAYGATVEITYRATW